MIEENAPEGIVRYSGLGSIEEDQASEEEQDGVPDVQDGGENKNNDETKIIIDVAENASSDNILVDVESGNVELRDQLEEINEVSTTGTVIQEETIASNIDNLDSSPPIQLDEATSVLNDDAESSMDFGFE